MLTQLKNLVKDEEAPTAVEYAIMVAAIAVAVITVVFSIGESSNAVFQKVDTKMETAAQ